MDKLKLFENFLDSLKGHDDDSLIEAVKKGAQIYFENDGKEEKVHEKTLTFKLRDGEGTVSRILELFKGKQNGTLLLDPEGDLKEPVAALVIKEYQTKPDSYSHRYRLYDFEIIDPEDEGDKMKTCKINVKSNKKEDIDRVMNNFKQLFDDIGSLGNGGHSYGIKFVPNSNQAKIREFGWDGDGSDFIDTKSIKIS